MFHFFSKKDSPFWSPVTSVRSRSISCVFVTMAFMSNTEHLNGDRPSDRLSAGFEKCFAFVTVFKLQLDFYWKLALRTRSVWIKAVVIVRSFLFFVWDKKPKVGGKAPHFSHPLLALLPDMKTPFSYNRHLALPTGDFILSVFRSGVRRSRCHQGSEYPSEL